jgi:hypothetical protein
VTFFHATVHFWGKDYHNLHVVVAQPTEVILPIQALRIREKAIIIFPKAAQGARTMLGHLLIGGDGFARYCPAELR